MVKKPSRVDQLLGRRRTRIGKPKMQGGLPFVVVNGDA